MGWTIRSISAPVVGVELEDEQGVEKTVLLRRGRVWPEGLASGSEAVAKKPKSRKRRRKTDKVRRKHVTQEDVARSNQADEADTPEIPGGPDAEASSSEQHSLSWTKGQEDGRDNYVAAYRGGAFKIVAGDVWALFFEFEDGALRLIAFGEEHAYLQRFAEYLVQHGPPGFENAGAFLEHLQQQGEIKLPAKRPKLEWQADTAAVGRRYIARVGALGRIEFQKSGSGAPYGIEWTSTAGATMTLGDAARVTDAKRLSSSFAQTMLALARAGEGGDAVDGDPAPAPALEWSERVEDRRTIHVARVEGGELQLVPTLLGAHALFFQRSEADWDAIDCGRMETMKEKALEYAASRGLIKAQEPGAEPEIPSQSEAEKQAAIMGGLKSLLGEMAEGL